MLNLESCPPGIKSGSRTSMTLTIPRNDFESTVSVATPAQEVAEGSSVTLEFTRTAGDQTKALTIPLVVTGTAQASDYTLPSSVEFAPSASTASVTLDVVDDPDFEVDETVIVELGTLPSETLLGTPKSVTLTISRNDADTTVSMTTADQEATEGNSVTLELSRLGGDLSRTLTVPLIVTGTAQASDYELPVSVTFESSESTASVTLDITDDPGFEASETVIVGFGVLPNEVGGGTSDSVTITIPENDVQTVNAVTTNQNVAEGESSTLEFSRVGGDHSQPLTIPLSLGGTSQGF